MIFQIWTSCARTWRGPWVSHKASSQHLGHHCLEVQLSFTLAFSTHNDSYFLFLCILSLLPLLSLLVSFPSLPSFLFSIFLYPPPLSFLLSLFLYPPLSHSSSLSSHTLPLSSSSPLYVTFRRETAGCYWLCTDRRSNSSRQLL